MSIIRLPKEIKNRIIATIPEALIKERDGGGGKMLSYISGSTVTDMLNTAFGYMWNWEVIKEWIQESTPWFNQYSKAPENEKIMHNGKKGTWDNQAPVAHVRGRLTVMFVDENGIERVIVKEGFGSKSIIGKQSEQESIFKAAGTDALKKAASLLGIGLELYRGEDEQMYFDELNYEDPWTEELQEKYQAEREYLKSVMDQYDLDEESMAQYVADFSDETLFSLYDIVPENIEAFVAYLKERIATATAASEQKAKLQKKEK